MRVMYALLNFWKNRMNICEFPKVHWSGNNRKVVQKKPECVNASNVYCKKQVKFSERYISGQRFVLTVHVWLICIYLYIPDIHWYNGIFIYSLNHAEKRVNTNEITLSENSNVRAFEKVTTLSQVDRRGNELRKTDGRMLIKDGTKN